MVGGADHRSRRGARLAEPPLSMESEVLTVETGGRLVNDLTDSVRRFCPRKGDGLCHVFAPHATAGTGAHRAGLGN